MGIEKLMGKFSVGEVHGCRQYILAVYVKAFTIRAWS
jgi:hypothetical protein